MNVALFKDDWFHEMIAQQIEAHPKASDDAKLAARAQMTAGAFIAEAISDALTRDDFNALDYLDRLAEAAETIASGITNMNAMAAGE